MRRFRQIIFIGCILLVSVQCGKDIEDPVPPSTPVWVEKTAPESPVESGIDADPLGDYIVLQWHKNPDNDISGYELYRTSVSSDSGFDHIADIDVFTSSGVDTFYIDDSVRLETNYFYYLRAFDIAGNKSPRSDTIRYQIIEKVDLTEPLGNIQELKPIFKWYDFSTVSYEYVIKIINIKTKEVIWISRLSRPNYGDLTQSVRYNFDNQAIQASLNSGSSYQWRVDAIALVDRNNVDLAGSESFWGYFATE